MSLDLALRVVQGPVVPWFDPVTFGGLCGGVGGSVLGILGGTLGALGSAAQPRRVRAAVVTANVTCAASGCLLGAGLIAVAAGQPSGVSQPLINIGSIGLGAFVGLRYAMVRRHAELTQKREQEPPTPV